MCSTYFYFHLKLVICEITDSLVICLHDCIQVLRYDSSERILHRESHAHAAFGGSYRNLPSKAG